MEHSRTERVHKKHPFSTFTIGAWFSWQELTGRKIVFIINLILIAFLISFAVTLDFMGKARKSTIDYKIDYMGPSLSLVPKGIRSSDLVTAKMKGRTYSQEVFSFLQRDMSYLLRGSEPRLIMNMPVELKEIPAVGIDFRNAYSYPFTQFTLKDNEVLLGTLAAKKFGKGIGDELKIQSRAFTVAWILETAGGIDDLSVFMSLDVLQELTGKEGLINEIRLFPVSDSALKTLQGLLRVRFTQIDIADSYRGQVAEEAIDTTLGDYQKAIYAAAFILIGLCIIISTYINLDGRKVEISTIHTLGARKGIIFQILLLRTVWITFLGSLIGQLLALLVTFLQDHQIPLQHIWSWKSFALVIIGTVFLGLLVTTPFTFYSVYRRNLISHL